MRAVSEGQRLDEWCCEFVSDCKCRNLNLTPDLPVLGVQMQFVDGH
jgi:hypothetical protein